MCTMSYDADDKNLLQMQHFSSLPCSSFLAITPLKGFLVNFIPNVFEIRIQPKQRNTLNHPMPSFCIPLLIPQQTLLQMHNNNTSPPTGESKDNPTWHPNRAYIQLSTSIVIDSCFPGGNVATATLVSLAPLTIEIEGNTDISMDPSAKYWLYFRIRGFRKDRPLKFVLKNANHLRKYLGQTRIRPYMVYREEGEELWQSSPTPIQLSFAENAQLQGVFNFQSEKNGRDRKPHLSSNDLHREKMGSTATTEQTKRGSCYFAIYYPYGHDDLMRFIERLRQRQKLPDSVAYFNQETITYSFERRKIALLTITSGSNIESFSEREPCPSQEIFPHPKDRPFKLKNCPVVLLTARVHPSETSSSYFIEGLVDFLLGNSRAAAVLRELFIFQIIPMLNPDGVEHGNFRFDHELRNLNRYYGQASIEKTPAIRAAEILINFYKNPHEQAKITSFFEETYSRLFFYADVHGHSSAMPSFIYGNHTDRLQHAIENKAFCKILQQNFLPGGFSKGDSDFSKKNMTSQQKHDEFSKLCSGRVFAGRAESVQQQVFHSYTIEVLPYWQQFSRRRNDKEKGQKVNAMDYARMLGKAFALSLLDLLDINPESRFNEAEMQKLRRHVEKQCINEQSRKLLTFKRVQSCNEQASLQSAKGKGSLDRSSACLKEYITRWFSNESYLRNILAKQELMKESKVAKFLKFAQNSKNGQSEVTESPRKPQIRHGGSKAITEPRQSTREHVINPKQRMIFVCRKQRGKVETRINKQTLQLQHQFLDLLPVQPRFNPNQLQVDFATYKKESLPKRDANSTDRYQHEILSTIAHQEQRKVAFEVKVKEIVAKRNNSRTQTETITSEPTLSECPSSIPHSFLRKQRERSTPARDCGRPSFIEEFMLKIREQRESANVFLHKYDPPEQLKICKAPARSSIREQLQEQERKLLPILRRNKIFTMVTEGKEESGMGRGFESMASRRKGAREDGLEEAVLKTKKILIAQKKEEIIREQLLKKSQKMSQYKS